MPTSIVGQQETTRAEALCRGELHRVGNNCGLISAELVLRLTPRANATCITLPAPESWLGKLFSFAIRAARRTRLDQELTTALYEAGEAADCADFRFTLRTKAGVVRLALVRFEAPKELGLIALEEEL
ncbi:MAG: hypothetical protein IV100_26535 [Myxococcales bacterium]|nr:hypothetical protein [Myxococcales bacterium]